MSIPTEEDFELVREFMRRQAPGPDAADRAAQLTLALLERMQLPGVATARELLRELLDADGCAVRDGEGKIVAFTQGRR